MSTFNLSLNHHLDLPDDVFRLMRDQIYKRTGMWFSDYVEVPAAETPLAARARAELRLVPEVLLLPAVRPARRGGVRSDLRPRHDERDVLLPRAGAARRVHRGDRARDSGAQDGQEDPHLVGRMFIGRRAVLDRHAAVGSRPLRARGVRDFRQRHQPAGARQSAPRALSRERVPRHRRRRCATSTSPATATARGASTTTSATASRSAASTSTTKRASRSSATSTSSSAATSSSTSTTSRRRWSSRTSTTASPTAATSSSATASR